MAEVVCDYICAHKHIHFHFPHYYLWPIDQSAAAAARWQLEEAACDKADW